MHSTLFHAGDSEGYGHHDRRSEQADAPRHLAEKMAQHRLGDFIIGDHPIAQRTHDLDVFLIHAAQHLARGLADLDNAFVFDRKRHQGGFLEHNLLVLVDQHIDGAQI